MSQRGAKMLFMLALLALAFTFVFGCAKFVGQYLTPKEWTAQASATGLASNYAAQPINAYYNMHADRAEYDPQTGIYVKAAPISGYGRQEKDKHPYADAFFKAPASVPAVPLPTNPDNPMNGVAQGAQPWKQNYHDPGRGFWGGSFDGGHLFNHNEDLIQFNAETGAFNSDPFDNASPVTGAANVISNIGTVA